VASRMATDSIWQALREEVWEPLVRAPALAAPVLAAPVSAASGAAAQPATLESGAPGSTATRKLGAGQETGASGTVDLVDKKLAEAVVRANRVVYDARIAKVNDMSTTVTLALVINGLAHIANVGDSRTYLWNAAGLRPLTKDHSLVQRLVDDGQMNRDEVYSHPQRNLIYKSIGDRPDVQPDIYRHSLAPDDRLILCSDGLWEMVHDDGIEEVLLSEPDPQRASDRLVANANLAGGDDNISVIIVQAVRD
jgi:serine/threonine protein phosphatase PrpC